MRSPAVRSTLLSALGSTRQSLCRFSLSGALLFHAATMTHGQPNGGEFRLSSRNVDVLWAREFASGMAGNIDAVVDMATDRWGNVYVTGGSTVPDPASYECVTVKYDRWGNQEWAAHFSGGSGTDIVVDADGNAYVAAGGCVVKYDPSGDEVWVFRAPPVSDLAGGTNRSVAVSLDSVKNVYFLGYHYHISPTWRFTFLYKISPAGERVWGRTWQNPLQRAQDVLTDGLGGIYVVGIRSSVGAGDDYHVEKIDAAGNIEWDGVYDGPGSGDDQISGAAVDMFGNFYATGSSEGTAATGADFATVKYDRAGNQLWVARYSSPGSLRDAGTAITLGRDGSVYVTGTSDSGIATVRYEPGGRELWIQRYQTGDGYVDADLAVAQSGEVYVAGSRHEKEGVILKYDPIGNLVWGGALEVRSHALAATEDGTVLISGQGGGEAGGRAWSDYSTVRIDSSGSQLWVARYNGAGRSQEKLAGLALDGLGNVYASGSSYTWGSNSSSGGGYGTVKYDPAGNVLWSARAGDGYATAVAVDRTGNCVVTGYQWGTGTGYDYFTVKYDPSGRQLWTSSYKGVTNGEDMPSAVALDGLGNVYVTGASGGDYATVKYDPLGRELWAVRYNGPGDSADAASALVVDRSGYVYVTGDSYGGASTGMDIATLKYDPTGRTIWMARHDAAGAAALAVDRGGRVFVAGKREFVTIMYDSVGKECWVARYEQSTDAEPASYLSRAIALDASGGIYVTGGGNYGFATVKYDVAGNERWVVRDVFGGGYNFSAAIGLDPDGRVYVGGTRTLYRRQAPGYTYEESHYRVVKCAQSKGIVENPGFEWEGSQWEFWTDGKGSFDFQGVDDGNAKAGRVVIEQPGSNVQLYQAALTLQPASKYRLRFQAWSNSGSDVSVLVHKDGEPYTNYGLERGFDLGSEWETHEHEFVTEGFSEPVADGRLRFWLAPYAKAGDEYLFDDVELEYLEPADRASGTVAGIGGEEPPGVYSLLQNYPNPFNPVTTIVAQWPASSDVKVTVFDILGRVVATLGEGRYPAGSHRFTLDASRLPSGVYIYRVSAGRYSEAKRMLLIR